MKPHQHRLPGFVMPGPPQRVHVIVIDHDTMGGRHIGGPPRVPRPASVSLEPIVQRAPRRVQQPVEVRRVEPAEQGDHEPSSPGFCSLFPEPGIKRLVRWGEFRHLLEPQVAHPDRLHESHRLPCRVQVYEATERQPISALAQNVSGSAQTRMRALRREMVASLRLETRLLPVARQHASGPRQPGWLLPGDRLLRLVLALDPTATSARPATLHNDATTPAPSTAPAGDHESAHVPLVSPGTARTAIPPQYMHESAFRRSRTQALADMAVAAAPGGGLLQRIRRIVEWASWREIRRWRIQLQDRSFDEQLWAVRPPRSGLWHPALRAWVRHTLEMAGYALPGMMTEWEVFWRRKAL